MTTLKAPVGYCSTPGCSNRASGKCTEHQKARRKATDERRGSRHTRGYGNAWTRTSDRWKATHPFCGMRADQNLHPEHSLCARRGLYYAGGRENPLVTDHILPKADGGQDVDTNYQTLCHRCHSAKTATENGGVQRHA